MTFRWPEKSDQLVEEVHQGKIAASRGERVGTKARNLLAAHLSLWRRRYFGFLGTVQGRYETASVN